MRRLESPLTKSSAPSSPQKRELAELPQRIVALETEQQALSAAMADPAFYQQDGPEIARTANKLKELEDELARAYQRWEELEQ